MKCIFVIFAAALRLTQSYPWGTDSCGAPNHPRGGTSTSTGISIVMDSTNTIILSSTKSFRGFFLQTNLGLVWSNPSTDSATSTLCGGGATAVVHTNANGRLLTKATVDCSTHKGASFTLTAYVVYSYSSAYVQVQKSFTCPSLTVTTATPTTAAPGASTARPVGGSGQFDTLGFISIQWTPYVYSSGPGRRLLSAAASSAPGYSDLQVYFNLQDKTTGWMGVGFGYTDAQMAGGKKAFVITKTASGCSIKFYTMESHTLVAVTGTDPWGVTPACTVLSDSLVSATMRLGGSSSITLPAQGTSMYALFAAGVGSSLGNHGSTKSSQQIDFLSTNSISSTSQHDVNPYYLWHGIVFIALFAILMPLTSFLILINRTKFYNAHKYLGIVIVVLLAAGWILVVPGGEGKEDGNYASFASTSVGLKHKQFGGIACWVAVGVCAGGVVLWFIRLPRTMRSIVRYIHGIVGIGLSFFGPYVVWTGWVQLQPIIPQIDALTNSPWVWLSLAIALGTIYMLWYAWNFASTSPRVSMMLGRKISEERRTLTMAQVDSMVANGKLILIVNGMVCEIPKSFSHPGGRTVLEQYNGREVGSMMNGSTSFENKGRQRNYTHSDDAFKQAARMSLGSLNDMTASAPDRSMVVPLADFSSSVTGTVQSMDQVNTAKDFPVRLFKISVTGDDGKLKRGSRVNMSLPAQSLSRPYTVCKALDGTIEFCIKMYPEGQFTSKLNRLKPGDTVNLSRPVPHPLIPANPSPPSLVVFIAGGTGVAPMIGYFNECTRIPLGGYLMWWVRNESDLFLVPEIEAWGRKFNVRIQALFTQPTGAGRNALLSRPPVNGRISSAVVLNVFGGALPIGVSEIAWVVSGPEGFVQSANTCFKDMDVNNSRILNLD